MTKTSLAQYARERVVEETRRELWRTVLRESEERYRHELLSIDEREEVCDRIVRLRRRLGLSWMLRAVCAGVAFMAPAFVLFLAWPV